MQLWLYQNWTPMAMGSCSPVNGVAVVGVGQKALDAASGLKNDAPIRRVALFLCTLPTLLSGALILYCLSRACSLTTKMVTVPFLTKNFPRH